MKTMDFFDDVDKDTGRQFKEAYTFHLGDDVEKMLEKNHINGDRQIIEAAFELGVGIADFMSLDLKGNNPKDKALAKQMVAAFQQGLSTP